MKGSKELRCAIEDWYVAKEEGDQELDRAISIHEPERVRDVLKSHFSPVANESKKRVERVLNEWITHEASSDRSEEIGDRFSLAAFGGIFERLGGSDPLSLSIGGGVVTVKASPFLSPAELRHSYKFLRNHFRIRKQASSGEADVLLEMHEGRICGCFAASEVSPAELEQTYQRFRKGQGLGRGYTYGSIDLGLYCIELKRLYAAKVKTEELPGMASISQWDEVVRKEVCEQDALLRESGFWHWAWRFYPLYIMLCSVRTPPCPKRYRLDLANQRDAPALGVSIGVQFFKRDGLKAMGAIRKLAAL
ncbi:MAG: hypothetical protein ACR2HJ_11625 [Fimbriimonadales bacterium]